MLPSSIGSGNPAKIGRLTDLLTHWVLVILGLDFVNKNMRQFEVAHKI